jgi:hypothetical protein
MVDVQVRKKSWIRVWVRMRIGIMAKFRENVYFIEAGV